MALSVAALTHNSDTSAGTPINTASITPGTNTVILLAVLGNGLIPSGITPSNAAGLTWANMYSDGNLGNTRSISIWRAMASSPSSAAIPLNNPNGLQLMWDILEVSGGVEPSGTNGSGAVRQSSQNFGASPLDALLATSLSTSALVGLYHSRDDSDSPAVGSGYTPLDSFGFGGGIGLLATEWTIGVTSGACGWSSFTSSTSITGIEIQAATGVGVTGGAAGTGIYRLKRRPWSH